MGAQGETPQRVTSAAMASDMREEALSAPDSAVGQKHLGEVAKTRAVAELTAQGVDHIYGLIVQLSESEPDKVPIKEKVGIMNEVVKGCVEGSEDTPFVKLPALEEEFCDKEDDFKLAILKLCTQLDENGCAATADLLRQLLDELE